MKVFFLIKSLENETFLSILIQLCLFNFLPLRSKNYKTIQHNDTKIELNN